MTFFLLDEFLLKKEKKCFYINVKLLDGSNIDINNKNYIIFYLKYLFKDLDSFRLFYKEISQFFITKEDCLNIVFKIIEKFYSINRKNSNEKYFFILDNIYNNNTFFQIKKKLNH